MPQAVSDTLKDQLFLLCNYNYGDWVPVDTAERLNNRFTFKNIGKDLLFSLATYDTKNSFQRSYPFYISRDNKVLNLKPDHKNLIDFDMNTINSIENDQLHVFATGKDFRNKKSPGYIALMNIAEGKNRT